MHDDKSRMQHAMTSFALVGGFLMSPRPKPGRVESRPQDYVTNPKKR